MGAIFFFGFDGDFGLTSSSFGLLEALDGGLPDELADDCDLVDEPGRSPESIFEAELDLFAAGGFAGEVCFAAVPEFHTGFDEVLVAEVDLEVKDRGPVSELGLEEGLVADVDLVVVLSTEAELDLIDTVDVEAFPHRHTGLASTLVADFALGFEVDPFVTSNLVAELDLAGAVESPDDAREALLLPLRPESVFEGTSHFFFFFF